MNKLKKLDINNTNISGSLKPMSNLNKLKELNISNTDINSGVEYLPASLEEVSYGTSLRSTCKLTEIAPKLEAYQWKEISPSFTLKIRRKWEKQGKD